MTPQQPWDELSLDVETLDAALAYVDAYDESVLDSGDSTPSDSMHSGTPPPTSADGADAETPVGRGKRSGGASRSRQKDEIQYLRRHVSELEYKLAQLKRTAPLNNSDGDGDGDGDGGHSGAVRPPLPAPSMWEAVAERQYAQRHLAEVENAKLRSMLEEQIKVAKALERLLRKRAVTELMSAEGSLKRTRISATTDRPDDAEMFERLTSPFEEMYAQTDELLSHPRFAMNTTAQVRHVDVRDEENLGTSVILFDQYVLPFEFATTSKALWHVSVRETHSFIHMLYSDVDSTDDSMLKKVRVVIDHPTAKLRASINGWIAARRYTEENRVVMVWSALMDPETIGETPMEGVLMRQKGWTVIRPAPQHLCPPGVEQATVIQMHHIATAELGEDIENPKRKVGMLTNFLLRSTDFHLDSGRQMVENFMLDGTWKQFVED
ncbi:hypothetical protein PINS_up012555 [Pythium insidiosum]|nr:hypothetical protein PINS_up012555 [Pythium insidiosum]